MRCRGPELVALGALAAAGFACGGDDPPGPVTVTANCEPIESWSFPATQVTQRSSVILMFQGAGPGTGGGMGFSLGGAGADQFAIAPDHTDCDDGTYGPDRFCLMEVEFTPSAIGTAVAELEVMGARVALTGVAVAETAAGLFTEVANLSYVAGAYGVGVTTFYLSNQAAAAVELEPLAITGDGFVMDTASDCPATLGPGAACTIGISHVPTARDCGSGSLEIAGSAGVVSLPIDSAFVGGLQVNVRGPGAGVVTTSPAGIACAVTGAAADEVVTCARPFPDAGEVTLTAVPDADSFFNGWLYGRECDATSATCTVRLEPTRYQPTVFARFASPAAKRIGVTIEAAGALGWVETVDTRCGASCSLYVEPGDSLVVRPYSPSRFLGWGGACADGPRRCELGLIVNDRELTAMFARDDGEVATLLPAVPTTAGGVLPGGDLIVAGIDPGFLDAFPVVVSRLSAAGDVVWTRVLDDTRYANSWDVRVTADGEIYVFVIDPNGRPAVMRLGDDGGVVWTHDLAAAPLYPRALLATMVEAGPNLAVLTESGVVALARLDGAERWRVENVGVVRAVAALSDGRVVVARTSGIAGEIELQRFGVDGEPIAPSWTAVVGDSVALAADPLDRLVIVDDTAVVWLAADGSVDATAPIDPGFGAVKGVGVAVGADGTIVAARAHAVGVFPVESAGLGLEVFDAAGTRLWSVDKVPYLESDLVSAGTDAVIAGDVDLDAGGRIAVVGSYRSRPWAELFEP
jgi:hypothetical protein